MAHILDLGSNKALVLIEPGLYTHNRGDLGAGRWPSGDRHRTLVIIGHLDSRLISLQVAKTLAAFISKS